MSPLLSWLCKQGLGLWGKLGAGEWVWTPTGGWEPLEAASKIPPEPNYGGRGSLISPCPSSLPAPSWRGPGPSVGKWGAGPGPGACMVGSQLGHLRGPLVQARLSMGLPLPGAWHTQWVPHTHV